MTDSGTEAGQGRSKDTRIDSSEDLERLGMFVAKSGSGKQAPTAYLIRLAARLGVDPQVLTDTLDPDTVRRTRYPVIEDEQRDGTVLYKHPVYRPSS